MLQLQTEIEKLKTKLINAEITGKQAKTEVEKRNVEIGVLCEQIIKIRSDYEKDMKSMQEEGMKNAEKQGKQESEIEKKIRQFGEIKYILDENNALHDKLSALESKYISVNRELVTLRSCNMTLAEKERNLSTQRDSLMMMISDQNQTIKEKTKQCYEMDQYRILSMNLEEDLLKTKEELRKKSVELLSFNQDDCMPDDYFERDRIGRESEPRMSFYESNKKYLNETLLGRLNDSLLCRDCLNRVKNAGLFLPEQEETKRAESVAEMFSYDPALTVFDFTKSSKEQDFSKFLSDKQKMMTNLQDERLLRTSMDHNSIFD